MSGSPFSNNWTGGDDGGMLPTQYGVPGEDQFCNTCRSNPCLTPDACAKPASANSTSAATTTTTVAEQGTAAAVRQQLGGGSSIGAPMTSISEDSPDGMVCAAQFTWKTTVHAQDDIITCPYTQNELRTLMTNQHPSGKCTDPRRAVLMGITVRASSDRDGIASLSFVDQPHFFKMGNKMIEGNMFVHKGTTNKITFPGASIDVAEQADHSDIHTHESLAEYQEAGRFGTTFDARSPVFDHMSLDVDRMRSIAEQRKQNNPIMRAVRDVNEEMYHATAERLVNESLRKSATLKDLTKFTLNMHLADIDSSSDTKSTALINAVADPVMRTSLQERFNLVPTETTFTVTLEYASDLFTKDEIDSYTPQ